MRRFRHDDSDSFPFSQCLYGTLRGKKGHQKAGTKEKTIKNSCRRGTWTYWEKLGDLDFRLCFGRLGRFFGHGRCNCLQPCDAQSRRLAYRRCGNWPLSCYVQPSIKYSV